jgi:DoxX
VRVDQQQPKRGMGLPSGPAWNVVWSYAVLRFTLGITFLFHGLTRFVSGWFAFADQMVQSFHNTFLPDFMVRPFALSVPPVEAILGTLLCLGLFTRWTLIAGGLSGTCAQPPKMANRGQGLMFPATRQRRWRAAAKSYSGSSLCGGRPCCPLPTSPSYFIVDLYNSRWPSPAAVAQRLTSASLSSAVMGWKPRAIARF